MNPKREWRGAFDKSARRGGPPARRRRARLGWLGVSLALTIAALAILPAGAEASPSRYVFEMCDSALPAGGDAGVTFESTEDVYTAIDSCANPGGSLGIYQDDAGPETYAYWKLPIRPPPGGTIKALTGSAESCGVAGTVAFVFFNTWPTVGPGPWSGCGVEETRTFQLEAPSDLGPFFVWLGCENEGGCAYSWIYAHYFASTEVDPVPPTLGDLHGSLLSGSPLHGHQDLGVDAEDEGGGLSKVWATVNGAPAGAPDLPNCKVGQADNPSVQGTVATAITPCPTSVSPDWTLDTQAYPFHEGGNSVQVCASDFATLDEPNTSCSATEAVQVDNSCTASAVAGGEALSAHFSKAKSETIKVAQGQPAKVSGRLTGKTGNPIAGATLCVKMQTVGVDPEAKNVGTVSTDANGAYSYQVPPGPNREIVIGYRHDAFQLTRAVRYFARVKPSLQRSPAWLANGRPVHLWGQLPGPSNGERVVVLQANVVGSKRWITFRRATTNSQGDFHSKYRFRSTTRTTVYRFRALVPAQTDYPWAEGTSAAAKVLVRVGRRPRRG